MHAQAHKSAPLSRGLVMAGRFEIDSVLGEGASGVVYLAHEQPSGRRVALKVIHPHLCSDRQIYKRFQREAAILQRLEGPHLVKLLDFFQEGDLLVIALEFVDATSLEAMLAEHRPLDPKLAVEITLQVCAALGAAHAAGVVHRDLKPGNVLIEAGAEQGAVPSVRVVDFGLAKVVHGEQMTTGLTEHDMIFGTPEYMAPEQARGDEVDARCDIYAAGIMLYEMAVGEVPFRGRTPIASMTAHLTQAPPSPRVARPDRSISPALDAVILRSLAKNPADRYPTARAFAEALAAARDQKRVVTPPLGTDAGIGDTELSLSTTGLAHSPTIPSDPPSMGHGPTMPSADVEPPPARTAPAPRTESGPVQAAVPDTLRQPSGSRWVWTVVALLALALGVTIGVFVGGR